jgi:hypothetical protein
VWLLCGVLRFLVPAITVPSSPIVALIWRLYLPPKRRFLQELHGFTSRKTTFFIVALLSTRVHAAFFLDLFPFRAGGSDGSQPTPWDNQGESLDAADAVLTSD